MGVSVKAELQFITRKLCRCYSSVTEMVILFLKFFSLPPSINYFVFIIIFFKGKSFMATLDGTLSKTDLVVEIPLKK